MVLVESWPLCFIGDDITILARRDPRYHDNVSTRTCWCVSVEDEVLRLLK